jgi:hypothetical protein
MTVAAKRRRVRKNTELLYNKETGETCERKEEIVIDEQECEARALVQFLAARFAGQIDFILKEYSEDKDGKWTPDRARHQAAEGWGKADLEKLKHLPPDQIHWADLTAVVETHGMQGALELWGEIKRAAVDYVESGMHITEIVQPNGTPLERARMIALRSQLAEGWQPQNGIEHTLIDMMCLSFSQYLYWTAIAHERVLREANKYQDIKKGSPIYKEGKWNLPTIGESQAVDQANRLADGYHRQFMRTLRQLRDLRRYVPSVIVNNGGLVNVANQQVNVTRAE